MEKDTVTVVDMLKHHFQDDEVNFAEIKKEQAKHKELLEINGEHFSHFRKDITEIKAILLEQDKTTKLQNKIVMEHMARVEPVIRKFEDETTALKYNKAMGEKVVEVSKIVLAIGAIGGAMVWGIRKIL